MIAFLTKVKSEKGFTYIELLLILAFLVITLALVYTMFSYVQESWARSSAEARVIQDARHVLMSLEKEIRQARTPTAVGGAVESIPTSNDPVDRIRIYSDVTGDNIPEMIDYYLLNEALWRRVISASNDHFPFQYNEGAVLLSEEIVIGLVLNTDLFAVKEIVEYDPRRKVEVNILVDDSRRPLASPFHIKTNVISRSRINE